MQQILSQTLAAGILVATYTGDPSGHITVRFKAWTKGSKRIIPLSQADRIYVSDPTKGWGEPGFSIGAIDLRGPKAGLLIEHRTADPARVTAARYIFNAIKGKGPDTDILPATNCLRCGKELTDPVSIERQVGPDCYGKVTGSQAAPVTPWVWPEVQPADEYAALAAAPTAVVDWDEGAQVFTVMFGYDPQKVAALKSTFHWKDRAWDKSNKHWTVKRSAKTIQPLQDFASRNGLTITDEARDAMTDLPAAVAGTIDMDDKHYFTVSFDYDVELVNAVKSITTRSRQYDRENKVWRVTPGTNEAKALADIAGRFGLQVTPEAQAGIANLGGTAQEALA